MQTSLFLWPSSRIATFPASAGYVSPFTYLLVYPKQLSFSHFHKFFIVLYRSLCVYHFALQVDADRDAHQCHEGPCFDLHWLEECGRGSCNLKGYSTASADY